MVRKLVERAHEWVSAEQTITSADLEKTFHGIFLVTKRECAFSLPAFRSPGVMENGGTSLYRMCISIFRDTLNKPGK